MIIGHYLSIRKIVLVHYLRRRIETCICDSRWKKETKHTEWLATTDGEYYRRNVSGSLATTRSFIRVSQMFSITINYKNKQHICEMNFSARSRPPTTPYTQKTKVGSKVVHLNRSLIAGRAWRTVARHGHDLKLDQLTRRDAAHYPPPTIHFHPVYTFRTISAHPTS